MNGHAVVESSQDFRPKYRQLGILREYFTDEYHTPLTVLTATASIPDILEISKNIKMDKDLDLFDHHLFRSNLHYNVIKKIDEHKQLMSLLSKYGVGTQGLIYCNTRQKCEDLCSYLNRQGFKAEFFHSTLSKKEKTRILDGFVNDTIKIVIATSAFGTGINVAAVRFVINLDMPPSFNDCLQQMGRAGRDGLISQCYIFYSPQDINTLKFILRQSVKSPDRLRKAYKNVDSIVDFCKNIKDCRSRLLLKHYGQDLQENCNTCDNCKLNESN